MTKIDSRPKSKLLDMDVIEFGLFCCIAFQFFALIKPDSLDYIGLEWLDTLLMLLDCVALVVLAVLFLAGKIRFNPITMAITLLMVLLAISTAFGSKEYFELIKIAGPALVACMLTDYLFQHRPMMFLKSATWALLILFTINLLTILLTYPKGLYNPPLIEGNCYFLGYDNGMIYSIIPMCTYSILYSLVRTGKALSLVSAYCIGISALSVLYVQSATGIVALLVFALLLVINSASNNGSWIMKPLFLFALFFVATLLLVVFHIQTYFADFIYQVFGKDATLTGRTYLWDYAIDHIAHNPILGTGATTRSVVGINGHVYSHPHCLVLDLLYKGGMPVFAAFLVTLWLFARSYAGQKITPIRGIVLIGVFSLLVVEITGSVQFKPFFWALFSLVAYCGQIEELYEEQLQNKAHAKRPYKSIAGGR